MTVRASGFQLLQMGTEITPGTKVAATKIIGSFGITPTIKAEVKKYTAQGQIVPTAYVLGKDYTEGKIDGFPAYNEIDLLLASVINKVADGHYILKADTPSDPQTYSIEKGPAGDSGELFQYGVIAGLSLKGNREEVTLSGDMFGNKTLRGAITDSLTRVDPIPVSPDDVTITVGGTTVECFNWELNINGRWKAVWVVDASQNSYVAIVEAAEPEINVKIDVESNAAGYTHLDRLRAGNALTAAVISCSTTIGATTYNLGFTINTKVAEVTEFKDEDGVYAMGYTLGAAPGSDGTVIDATIS